MPLDALALPPEINVGRLISGASVVPMQNAQMFYTNLSATYVAEAQKLAMLMGQLAVTFHGPSAVLMQAAYVPYIASMHFTAEQLGVAAVRAQAQVGAYVSAVAAMPTLPELAALQTQHATLVATNPLVAGANTPAIVANEAAYAAEWARAATVQSAYFAATAVNSAFEPFAPAPPITKVPNAVAEGAIAATTASAATTPLRELEVARLTAEANANNMRQLGTHAATTAVEENRRALDRGKIANDNVRQVATRGAMTAAQAGMGVGTMALSQGTSLASKLASLVTQKMQHNFDNAGIKHPGGIPGGQTGGAPSAAERLAAGGAAGGGMLGLFGGGGADTLRGGVNGLRVPPTWMSTLPGAAPLAAVAAVPLSSGMVPPMGMGGGAPAAPVTRAQSRPTPTTPVDEDTDHTNQSDTEASDLVPLAVIGGGDQ